MMSKRRRSTLGIILVSNAALGILISLVGIVLIWTVGLRLRANIEQILTTADSSLSTTDSGLIVLSNSLANTRDSISLMEITSLDISKSIDQTIPMIDSTSVLVGDNMVEIIQRTQDSLDSAQSSAKLVDDTLGLITSLPIIGQRYAPSQSLSDSIQKVSQSLDGLPDTLTGLQTNLNHTATDMQAVQDQFTSLSINLQHIEANVQSAQEVVKQYQEQVSSLKVSVANLRSGLPLWILVGQVIATLFLVWLAVAQIGLILQGRQLMRSVAVVVNNPEIES